MQHFKQKQSKPMTSTETFDRTQFLKQFYPANPFAGGVLIDALQIPIEVLVTCYQADRVLEQNDFDERVVVTAGKTIVQLDHEWTERWLARKSLIHTYVHAKVHDHILGLADRWRNHLLEIDDPQLHQELIEVDKAFAESTALASALPAD